MVLPYIHLIDNLAKKEPHKIFNIYVKEGEGWKDGLQEINRHRSTLSSNIKIIPYKTLNFLTMDFIIRNATLPILVTGDVSLSQAIQYEKFFLYDTGQKRNAAEGFLPTLDEKGLFFFDQAKREEYLTAIQNLKKNHSLVSKIIPLCETAI